MRENHGNVRICRFAESEAWDAPIHYALQEGDGSWEQIDNPFVLGEIHKTGEPVNDRDMQFLAPCEPSKIVCVGVNYRKHADEMGHGLPEQPLLFLKPPSSVIACDEPIMYPRQSQRVDHEAELAVVIGKRAKNVTEEEALNYIFGYTVLNDVTARDLQKRDGQWTRGKGFDTFCPIGPWIVTDMDWQELDVSCRVNQEIRQQGNTGDMVFGVPQLVSFISKVMTLLPGDVIATGTPEGVGPLRKGDMVEVEVSGIGILRNRIH